jgi:hypothetical protein
VQQGAHDLCPGARVPSWRTGGGHDPDRTRGQVGDRPGHLVGVGAVCQLRAGIGGNEEVVTARGGATFGRFDRHCWMRKVSPISGLGPLDGGLHQVQTLDPLGELIPVVGIASGDRPRPYRRTRQEVYDPPHGASVRSARRPPRGRRRTDPNVRRRPSTVAAPFDEADSGSSDEVDHRAGHEYLPGARSLGVAAVQCCSRSRQRSASRRWPA